jgi:hypothetical protein
MVAVSTQGDPQTHPLRPVIEARVVPLRVPPPGMLLRRSESRPTTTDGLLTRSCTPPSTRQCSAPPGRGSTAFSQPILPPKTLPPRAATSQLTRVQSSLA